MSTMNGLRIGRRSAPLWTGLTANLVRKIIQYHLSFAVKAIKSRKSRRVPMRGVRRQAPVPVSSSMLSPEMLEAWHRQ